MRTRPDHEFGANGEQYKVYRLLDPLIAKARKKQRAGYSVDVRIYARRKPDGTLWGEVAFIGQNGRLVTISGNTASEALPLDSPKAVEQFLSSVTTRLFGSLDEPDAPRVDPERG